MFRLRRLLFTTNAALSLLICVASAGLWVRSYGVNDHFYQSQWRVDGLTASESAWWFFAGRGEVAIGHRWQRAIERADAIGSFKNLIDHPEYSWKQDPSAELWQPDAGDGFFRRHRFRYQVDPMPSSFVADRVTGAYSEWDAPLWFICVLFALPPLWWLRTARARRMASGPGFPMQPMNKPSK